MKYLALGDSYTIGEKIKSEDNFPNQLANLLQKQYYPDLEDSKIIAKTGWTSQDLYREVQSQDLKNEYDLVTLLIGVNDQYQGLSVDDYGKNLLHLITKAIWLAKGQSSHVFICSIPDWGITPFGKNEGRNPQDVSKAIDEFNEKSRLYSIAYRCPYIKLTEISREQGDKEEFLAEDKLHYSGEAYKQWASKACSRIAKKLDYKET